EKVFEHFIKVDERFSTYKHQSEISRINRGELKPQDYSRQMREIFFLAEQTKSLTKEYFNIFRPDGKIDPSGLVKGWAIYNAAKILQQDGFKKFFIEAGGDIQAESDDKAWTVGIRNPFNKSQIVKVLHISHEGMATSGNYERGNHIYNPH